MRSKPSKIEPVNIYSILAFYRDGRVIKKLNNIERILNTMAIDQETFDTDLATLITAIGSLVDAVNNLPKADFSAEDQTVRDAAAKVADELNKLNPPTPVPTPEPAPEPSNP